MTVDKSRGGGEANNLSSGLDFGYTAIPQLGPCAPAAARSVYGRVNILFPKIAQTGFIARCYSISQ